jgi:hypothetical protein
MTRSSSESELPPIDDPFVVRPPPPSTERATTSKLAITSVLALLFGPVGAVCAVVFGIAARREIEAAGSRRSGYFLATIGAALGGVLTVAWIAGFGLLAWMHRLEDPMPSVSSTDEPAATAHGVDPAQSAGPSPPTAAQHTDPQAGGTVPKQTRLRHEGSVTIVDVGTGVSSLSEELAKQRAEAASKGETVVVMTTKDPCDPCRGVDRSLPDPLMQTALSKVRLVRVDIEVFKEDLEMQKMPTERYPSFFMLSVDLTPKDAIDGGEWDDDIPQNIAPVLGAFVRGKYTARRQTWQPPPGSGVRL